MSAGKYDFKIEQGTSFTLSFIYKDSNSNPINLTGWCGRLVWKTNAGDTEIFSTENTNYSLYKFVIDNLNGRLTFQLPASITNNLSFSTAKYDLELQSPADLYVGGGKYTTRLLSGTITIVKRYSQETSNLECA